MFFLLCPRHYQHSFLPKTSSIFLSAYIIKILLWPRHPQHSSPNQHLHCLQWLSFYLVLFLWSCICVVNIISIYLSIGYVFVLLTLFLSVYPLIKYLVKTFACICLFFSFVPSSLFLFCCHYFHDINSGTECPMLFLGQVVTHWPVFTFTQKTRPGRAHFSRQLIGPALVFLPSRALLILRRESLDMAVLVLISVNFDCGGDNDK